MRAAQTNRTNIARRWELQTIPQAFAAEQHQEGFCELATPLKLKHRPREAANLKRWKLRT
jgi:hypothetical protein